VALRRFLALAIAIVFAAAAPPSRARGQGDGGDETLTLDADLVTVDLTVTDAKGEYVTDLKQSEVRLFEDGQPRGVDFFGASSRRDLSRPLACVLALDISGSITKREVEVQRDAAQRFVGLVRPESLFAVVAFNQEVRVLQKFTSDAKAVGKAFDKAGGTGGSTRLFDTLDQAVTMLSKAPLTRAGRRLRRVVVVVTDGYDSSSTIAPLELVRRAASAGVTIYSITLPSYMQTLDGRRERVITILDAHGVVPATGGADYSADDADYGAIFKAIAEEISSGYQLAFYPPDAKKRDGKFHPLRVEVTRPGVVVRASRQGYQSPEK
jgi:Ca-activated chloride channel family protein